jgi:hypothetical protein
MPSEPVPKPLSKLPASAAQAPGSRARGESWAERGPNDPRSAYQKTEAVSLNTARRFGALRDALLAQLAAPTAAANLITRAAEVSITFPRPSIIGAIIVATSLSVLGTPKYRPEPGNEATGAAANYPAPAPHCL